MALKNIFFLFLAFLFVGCEKDVDASDSTDLQNTLGQSLSGYEGSYEDYFFPLDKKLDISYSTNLNSEYNNSDTLNLQTFPEYLLYISSDESGDSTDYMSNSIDDFESSMFNSDDMQFVDYDVYVNNDTVLTSSIVVSSPKHKDYKSYEWSYDYGRYIGSQDIDHQDCSQNAPECLSVDYFGEGQDQNSTFNPTLNIITVEDSIIFTRITTIIDSISENFYSYLDLSDYDTTIVEQCEEDYVQISEDSIRVDCQAFKDTLVFEYEVGILGIDSAMFWNINAATQDTTVGELPNNLLVTMDGDTLTSFIPNQSYTLENGRVITPINLVTYRDTVVKPYTDYRKLTMLLENHIIDEIKDDSYSYNIMKSSIGWENNGIDMNSSGYFIYRNDDYALYELIRPSYFNYYGGVWDDQNELFNDNGWTPHAQNIDSVLFYLPFRDGEVVEYDYIQVFDDTSMVDGSENGNSARYQIETKYEVDYGSSIFVDVVDFSDNDSITSGIKTFEDVFKVTKSASMTMLGSGMRYNEKQTYWIAKGYGIIKQLIEYSWGDYDMVTAHEWVISRYNESAPGSQIVLNSLDELAHQFGEEQFISKKSAGITKFAPKFK